MMNIDISYMNMCNLSFECNGFEEETHCFVFQVSQDGGYQNIVINRNVRDLKRLNRSIKKSEGQREAFSSDAVIPLKISEKPEEASNFQDGTLLISFAAASASGSIIRVWSAYLERAQPLVSPTPAFPLLKHIPDLTDNCTSPYTSCDEEDKVLVSASAVTGHELSLLNGPENDVSNLLLFPAPHKPVNSQVASVDFLVIATDREGNFYLYTPNTDSERRPENLLIPRLNLSDGTGKRGQKYSLRQKVDCRGGSICSLWRDVVTITTKKSDADLISRTVSNDTEIDESITGSTDSVLSSSECAISTLGSIDNAQSSRTTHINRSDSQQIYDMDSCNDLNGGGGHFAALQLLSKSIAPEPIQLNLWPKNVSKSKNKSCFSGVPASRSRDSDQEDQDTSTILTNDTQQTLLSSSCSSEVLATVVFITESGMCGQLLIKSTLTGEKALPPGHLVPSSSLVDIASNNSDSKCCSAMRTDGPGVAMVPHPQPVRLLESMLLQISREANLDPILSQSNAGPANTSSFSMSGRALLAIHHSPITGCVVSSSETYSTSDPPLVISQQHFVVMVAPDGIILVADLSKAPANRTPSTTWNNCFTGTADSVNQAVQPKEETKVTDHDAKERDCIEGENELSKESKPTIHIAVGPFPSREDSFSPTSHSAVSSKPRLSSPSHSPDLACMSLSRTSSADSQPEKLTVIRPVTVTAVVRRERSGTMPKAELQKPDMTKPSASLLPSTLNDRRTRRRSPQRTAPPPSQLEFSSDSCYPLNLFQNIPDEADTVIDIGSDLDDDDLNNDDDDVTIATSQSSILNNYNNYEKSIVPFSLQKLRMNTTYYIQQHQYMHTNSSPTSRSETDRNRAVMMKPGEYSQVLGNMLTRSSGDAMTLPTMKMANNNWAMSPSKPLSKNDNFMTRDTARHYHLYLNELNEKRGLKRSEETTEALARGALAAATQKKASPSRDKVLPTPLPTLPSLSVNPRAYVFKNSGRERERERERERGVEF